MVRTVSRGRTRARADRGRAQRQAREGEHRREPGSGDALWDPVDPEHDALRGRRAEGLGGGRDAEGHARAPARVRELSEGPARPPKGRRSSPVAAKRRARRALGSLRATPPAGALRAPRRTAESPRAWRDTP